MDEEEELLNRIGLKSFVQEVNWKKNIQKNIIWDALSNIQEDHIGSNIAKNIYSFVPIYYKALYKITF